MRNEYYYSSIDARISSFTPKERKKIIIVGLAINIAAIAIALLLGIALIGFGVINAIKLTSEINHIPQTNEYDQPVASGSATSETYSQIDFLYNGMRITASSYFVLLLGVLAAGVVLVYFSLRFLSLTFK